MPCALRYASVSVSSSSGACLSIGVLRATIGQRKVGRPTERISMRFPMRRRAFFGHLPVGLDNRFHSLLSQMCFPCSRSMISYLDEYGKRHRKQFPTGLPEKGNRRNAEAELARIRKEFKPPATVIAGDWSPDMLSQIICSNGWRSLKCA